MTDCLTDHTPDLHGLLLFGVFTKATPSEQTERQTTSSSIRYRLLCDRLNRKLIQNTLLVKSDFIDLVSSGTIPNPRVWSFACDCLNYFGIRGSGGGGVADWEHHIRRNGWLVSADLFIAITPESSRWWYLCSVLVPSVNTIWLSFSGTTHKGTVTHSVPGCLATRKHGVYFLTNSL